MTTVRGLAKRRQGCLRRYSERVRGARGSHQDRRHAEVSFGALAASLATRITMPLNPFGEPQEWEPPQLELRIEPANLD